MEFKIQREALLQPLQMIMGAVEKRQTMPILGNALIRIENNRLTMIATDLEVELHGFSQVISSEKTGEITVPARKLLEITRALLENSEITIALEDQILVIASGKSRFKLLTLPAQDFPNVEEGTNKVEFSVSSKDLRFLIERVYFSMAHQDVRYFLNGLYLEKNSQGMRAVAIDGHRLALCSMDLALSAGESKVIVPRKGIIELLRLLDNNEKTVTINLGENHIRVIGENYSFISKLIDGVFPDYQKVIPKISDKKISLERDVLKQSLARVAILSNEKFHGVKVFLREERLIVEAHNNEQEESKDEIAVDYKGEPLEIGFNVNYLLEVLNVLPSGQVTVALHDSNSSILIEEANDKRCLYVIMPMRL